MSSKVAKYFGAFLLLKIANFLNQSLRFQENLLKFGGKPKKVWEKFFIWEKSSNLVLELEMIPQK